VEEAREEGVEFRFQRNPVRAIAEGGRLARLECVAMA
jgi:NADPH-dependent glutamate synthase beta subunit-like oxidoreductase